MTSAFGVSRPNGPHKGVDYSAPAGTPIQAVDFGLHNLVVTEVLLDNRTAGNALRMTGSAPNGDIIEISVMHMLNAPMKKVGDPVAVGDLLGQVGSTGRSTGDHMHLEMRKVGGEHFDPITYLALIPNARGQGEILNSGSDVVYRDLAQQRRTRETITLPPEERTGQEPSIENEEE